MVSWFLVLAGLVLVVSAAIRIAALRRRGVTFGVMRGAGDSITVMLALGGLGLLLLSTLADG